MAGIYLLEDVFTLKDVDVGGKKFDKVSRLLANSDSYGLTLELDVHSDLWEPQVSRQFTMVLTKSLGEEGSATSSGSAEYDNFLADRHTLMDKFEYVMYGTVFSIEKKNHNTEVIASFGGLLMSLRGDSKHLAQIANDSKVYLLMKHN
jgi:DNA-directed RNA polymerases I, II, and III subunit RPABC3